MLYQPLHDAGVCPHWVCPGAALAGAVLFSGTQKAHVPSLIFGSDSNFNFQLWMFGLVADLMAANRKLMEELQVRLRRLDADSSKKVRF